MHDPNTRLANGEECDALPRNGWRQVLKFAAGERKAVKARYNRRARRNARLACREG